MRVVSYTYSTAQLNPSVDILKWEWSCLSVAKVGHFLNVTVYRGKRRQLHPMASSFATFENDGEGLVACGFTNYGLCYVDD